MTVNKELKPLDNNGTIAVKIGSGLWFASLILLIVFRKWLIENGHENWIWIAASGFALGLLGIRYTINRAKRINKATEPNQSDLIHDFE